MNNAKCVWEVSITTGGGIGAFHALRAKRQDWYEQALANKDRVYSDDEDSDVQFSIAVTTLADLVELLVLIQGTKHLSGLAVFAVVETDNGVRAQTCIGRGYAETDATTHCEVMVDETRRQDAMAAAIKQAMTTLSGAVRP